MSFISYQGYEGVGGYARAVRDLEAVAGELAKRGDVRLKLVVTVSEGFFVKSNATARLRGYASWFMLVEHMDYNHFQQLYEEYSGKYGPCSVGVDELYSLVGGAPGYLRELCHASREQLYANIRLWLGDLERSLSTARNRLGGEPREVIALAYEALTGSLRPLVQPELYELAETLVEHNIAYPCYTSERIEYRPQLPVYLTALELAIEHGLDSLFKLDPGEVHRESVRRRL